MPRRARFLNVNLEVGSRGSLAPLARALHADTFQLESFRRGGRRVVVFELAGETRTAESTVRGFCRILANLTGDAKKCWEGAAFRNLDVGIEAGSGQASWRHCATRAVREYRRLPMDGSARFAAATSPCSRHGLSRVKRNARASSFPDIGVRW